MVRNGFEGIAGETIRTGASQNGGRLVEKIETSSLPTCATSAAIAVSWCSVGFRRLRRRCYWLHNHAQTHCLQHGIQSIEARVAGLREHSLEVHSIDASFAGNRAHALLCLHNVAHSGQKGLCRVP